MKARRRNDIVKCALGEASVVAFGRFENPGI